MPGAVTSAGCSNLDLEVEQEADALLADGLHHGLEHDESLALVLHQRVTLGHGPQADAFLEVVHLVEVFLPLAPDHGQDHAAFEFAHALGADRLLAGLVDQAGIGEDFFPEELHGDPGLAAGLVDDVVRA